MAILFFVLLAVNAVFTAKVSQWHHSVALNNTGEAPLMFLQKPRFYTRSMLPLFLLAFLSTFGLGAWYVWTGLLVLVLFVASGIGQARAFEAYRLGMRQSAARESDPIIAANMLQESLQTNAELRQMQERLKGFI